MENDKMMRGLYLLNSGFGNKAPRDQVKVYYNNLREKFDVESDDFFLSRCKEAVHYFTAWPSLKDLLYFVRNVQIEKRVLSDDDRLLIEENNRLIHNRALLNMSEDQKIRGIKYYLKNVFG